MDAPPAYRPLTSKGYPERRLAPTATTIAPEKRLRRGDLPLFRWLSLWKEAMGKASPYRAACDKPAMELSPQRVEQFRSQVTRSSWRYAAQGPLAEKVKPHILRLGRGESPAVKGVGFSVKVAILM